MTRFPCWAGYKVDNDGVPAGETRVVERGILEDPAGNPQSGRRGAEQHRKQKRRRSGSLQSLPCSTGWNEPGGNEGGTACPGRGKRTRLRDRGAPSREPANDTVAAAAVRVHASGRVREIEPGAGDPGFQALPGRARGVDSNAELLGLSESSFREIVAASETLTAYHTTYRPQGGFALSALFLLSSGPTSSTVVSLVVPQLLFEDVTLKRPTGMSPTCP